MRKALVRYIARGTTCRVTRNKDRPSALKRVKTENPQTTGEGGSPQVKHAQPKTERAPRPAEKAAVPKWGHAQPKTESPQTSREGGSLKVGTCTAKDKEPPDQQRRRQFPSGDMHSQKQ